jgi:hypothetical protein
MDSTITQFYERFLPHENTAMMRLDALLTAHIYFPVIAGDDGPDIGDVRADSDGNLNARMCACFNGWCLL